ncbi:hypothetical protein CLOHYLEM_06757 [[Clostridium] hylemonae DSM 15053]|uniref:Uncharacterized protein n=1 Tax=[Clostridium] hylemonae DSM 15053 TaxID=553973 RepID=C0C3U5_9FIRM|nr:hypothetical protein CLOHYLEM_06757 [[Clostridium] hylemonae DSM 15053]
MPAGTYKNEKLYYLPRRKASCWNYGKGCLMNWSVSKQNQTEKNLTKFPL